MRRVPRRVPRAVPGKPLSSWPCVPLAQASPDPESFLHCAQITPREARAGHTLHFCPLKFEMRSCVQNRACLFSQVGEYQSGWLHFL